MVEMVLMSKSATLDMSKSLTPNSHRIIVTCITTVISIGRMPSYNQLTAVKILEATICYNKVIKIPVTNSKNIWSLSEAFSQPIFSMITTC